MEIPCWKVNCTRPAGRLPAGLTVLEGAPALLFYPYWAVALRVTFRLPLVGPVERRLPACVDGLTGRVALLPPHLEAEPVTAPDERVARPRVAMDEERVAQVREALLPVIIRKLRILATPTIEATVAGLVYKRLLIRRARYRDGDYSLYLDTLTGEWALRPRQEGL